MTQHDIAGVVDAFQIEGTFLDAAPYGSGHINDTYASRVRAANGAVVRYIHQRINHTVFRDPARLMDNIARVTEHQRRKILADGGDPDRECLTLVPSVDGAPYHRDDGGSWWRTYLFIEGARTYDLVEKPEHAYHAGRAFGLFQRQLADLGEPRLHETIPDFHHTPKRVAAFEEALHRDVAGRAGEARETIDFAMARSGEASRLVDLQAEGRVPERITHNDTKFNNVMIDDITGEGVCVIDLDTVMPGLVFFDFGDAVRTGANTALEDERDLSKVALSIERFEQLTRGFLETAGNVLTAAEIDELVFGARLNTYEIAVRFLTDHLAGDTYFKVHREGHNLERARAQFALVADMERRSDTMQAIVEQYRNG
jgi:Phosphotransferase enzyme family